jgi:NAD+ diphosphatase
LSPKHKNTQNKWFLFSNHRILLKGNNHLPASDEIQSVISRLKDPIPVGPSEDTLCYAAWLPRDFRLSSPFELRSLRHLLGSMDHHFCNLAGLAFQLARWNRIHQYCRKCGAALQLNADEGNKTCSQCKHMDYPLIHPCIIVAISHDDRILLARPKRIKNALFSVIAGYVEPGETLEHAVKREIKEEVGVEVDNLRYAGSQSWPFSSSLMVAFTADYKSGIVNPNPAEIDEAGWFTADELPPIPAKGSISRKLIDAFAAQTATL